jgi:hypothetical protein
LVSNGFDGDLPKGSARERLSMNALGQGKIGMMCICRWLGEHGSWDGKFHLNGRQLFREYVLSRGGKVAWGST